MNQQTCDCGGKLILATKQIATSRPVNADTIQQYRATFLWPHDDGSVEQAGYEFANASTEEYRRVWWGIMLERIGSIACQAERGEG